MRILVTGAKGFVGRNLVAELINIRDGKERRYGPHLSISEVMECGSDTPAELLDEFCRRADFVFNLAGVNRPAHQSEFMTGNFGFASTLLDCLRRHSNRCPVMLASSIQASLEGRFAQSEYGRSKLAAEELLQRYSEETGAPVLIYRFPNVFGKWCRPNYNSAVATFCHNIAHDLPIQVNDRSTRLQLLYVDDLVDRLVRDLLDPSDPGCASDRPYPVHEATLGEVADMIYEFSQQPRSLLMPEIPDGSLRKKLYSTFLSYLPPAKAVVDLRMNVDHRGSFTEILRSPAAGQVSVNVSLPGVTKGEHWHHSKWEMFVVVSGRALIEQRRIDSDEVVSFEVSADRLQAVYMLPGYTHSIRNLSLSEPLVTLMWANESFNPERPDTYHLPIGTSQENQK